MSPRFSIQLAIAAALGAAVWLVIDALPSHAAHIDVALALVTFVVGLLALPVLAPTRINRAARQLAEAPLEDLLVGLLGLGVGLFIAALLAIPLWHLPSPAGVWLPLVELLVVTVFFTQVAATRRSDVKALIARSRRPVAVATKEEPAAPRKHRVLLDTSAIIDGRIADIVTTGFVNGELIVPRFVLDELRHIGSSPDVLRRNRGRRGLDMLNKMSKDTQAPVVVMDIDAEDIPEVDAKLVQIARRLQCPIITNDFSLNRVAELQGVLVLNINQLANAVKPVVLPGEEMAVHIIQQGKELNQGVGYLDDGTMIVVEDGQRYINNDVEIIVTRVLQTVAGRMIFAHPKVHSNGR